MVQRVNESAVFDAFKFGAFKQHFGGRWKRTNQIMSNPARNHKKRFRDNDFQFATKNEQMEE